MEHRGGMYISFGLQLHSGISQNYSDFSFWSDHYKLFKLAKRCSFLQLSNPEFCNIILLHHPKFLIFSEKIISNLLLFLSTFCKILE
jgi:hypothetical protein